MKTQEEGGHLQFKEKGWEQIRPSGPSEGTIPAHTLILGLQPPASSLQKCLLFVTQSVVHSHVIPSKLYTDIYFLPTGSCPLLVRGLGVGPLASESPEMPVKKMG